MKPILDLPLIGKIQSYALFAVIGFFVVSLLALYCVNKKRYDIAKFNRNHFISLIGLAIGMKLFGMISVLLNILWDGQKFDITKIINSGIVFYGGIIGYYITFKILERKHENNFIFDIMAFCFPLFGVFGRIGCFLAGCCYGIESNSIFAIQYNRVSVSEIKQRIPVQLWEAMLDVMIFIIIIILYKKQKLNGKLIYLYFIIYGIIRFILEFFRGDTIRGVYGILSFSQIISIILICYGIFKLLKSKENIRKKKLNFFKL